MYVGSSCHQHSSLLEQCGGIDATRSRQIPCGFESVRRDKKREVLGSRPLATPIGEYLKLMQMRSSRRAAQRAPDAFESRIGAQRVEPFRQI